MIPGAKPGARLSSLFEPWRRVRARAGLDDVRLHDLRHSYASRALALGESLPVIAKLLGHAQIQTTARYTHLARETPSKMRPFESPSESPRGHLARPLARRRFVPAGNGRPPTRDASREFVL